MVLNRLQVEEMLMCRSVFAWFAAATALSLIVACSNGTDRRSSAVASITANPMATLSAMPAGPMFGPSCPSPSSTASGAGNQRDLATVPLGTAVASDPQLTTLSTAINRTNLLDELNRAPALTAFTPTNDAFTKLSQGNLSGFVKDNTLDDIVRYHLINQRLSPERLVGTHQTRQGADLTITGHGTDFAVNQSARVVCGNIQTANATVYLIDTVLIPPR